MIFSYICSIGNGIDTQPYLQITGVTGGTAPYYYSLNGLAHQTATTFNNLVHGYHVIHVRDSSGLESAYQSVYIPKKPTINTSYNICLENTPQGQLKVNLNLDNGTNTLKHIDENGNIWWISKQNPYINL